MSRYFYALLSFLLSFQASAAFAEGATPDPAYGQPIPKGIDLQTGVTPVKEAMHHFHVAAPFGVLWVAVAISVFVFLLLIWVVVRYNSKANPTPSKTSHNTLIEVIWTAVPILILLAIAIPSLKLLYYTERSPEGTEMTLKVIGHQWYWEYVYPDHNGITFSAYMKKKEELKEGEPRLLETDRRVILPVDTNIKLQVTAADVLHSFAVPAFGVKRDAVPGRLNETWVRITRPGVYYGQCSELCGADHAYMPIAIEAVSKEAFAAWVKKEQAAQGLEPAAPEAAAVAAPAESPAETAPETASKAPAH